LSECKGINNKFAFDHQVIHLFPPVDLRDIPELVLSPCVSGASLLLLRHGKSSVAFGPYRKTNPQSAKDHMDDPGQQQVKGCRNHHHDSD
jgi:hypothetical protein